MLHGSQPLPGVLFPAQQQGKKQLRLAGAQADGSCRLLSAEQAQGRVARAGGVQRFLQIVGQMRAGRFRRRGQGVQPAERRGADR